MSLRIDFSGETTVWSHTTSSQSSPGPRAATGPTDSRTIAGPSRAIRDPETAILCTQCGRNANPEPSDVPTPGRLPRPITSNFETWPLAVQKTKYEQCLAAVQTSEARIHELEKGNIDLRNKIYELEKVIAKLKGNKNVGKDRTWPQVLARLRETNFYSSISIYKLSCKEECSGPRVWHPGFVARAAIKDHRDDDSTDLGTPGSELCTNCGAVEAFPAPQLELESVYPVHGTLSECVVSTLPSTILGSILEHLLFFPGELVHCISRFDPFSHIEVDLDNLSAYESGLPKRFHVGSGPCAIATATRPNELLAPLLVCKRWLFLGAHVFYGLNTFAFSSIGEFGRFLRGIGPRAQRIQHLDLLWHGSLPYPNVPKEEFKKPGTSTRNRYLQPIPTLRRLQTLVIHINETGKLYMRRDYEYEHDIEFAEGHSAGKPDYRLTRNLHTVQGMDFVTMLRGMRIVLFYDWDTDPGKSSFSKPARQSVINTAFVRHVNLQVQQPKTAAAARSAMLENLTPLCEGSRPTAGDLEKVSRWYELDTALGEARGSFDLLRPLVAEYNNSFGAPGTALRVQTKDEEGRSLPGRVTMSARSEDRESGLFVPMGSPRANTYVSKHSESTTPGAALARLNHVSGSSGREVTESSYGLPTPTGENFQQSWAFEPDDQAISERSDDSHSFVSCAEAVEGPSSGKSHFEDGASSDDESSSEDEASSDDESSSEDEASIGPHNSDDEATGHDVEDHDEDTLGDDKELDDDAVHELDHSPRDESDGDEGLGEARLDLQGSSLASQHQIEPIHRSIEDVVTKALAAEAPILQGVPNPVLATNWRMIRDVMREPKRAGSENILSDAKAVLRGSKHRQVGAKKRASTGELGVRSRKRLKGPEKKAEGEDRRAKITGVGFDKPDWDSDSP